MASAVTLQAPDNPDGRLYQAVLEHLGAEYREFPGMSLTLAQARRLCGAEQWICGFALEALMEAGFLQRTHDGQYRRCSGAFIKGSRPRYRAALSAR